MFIAGFWKMLKLIPPNFIKMIYQDLLNSLSSNYLSREDAFGLLNGAVLDLADKNFNYLMALISVFGILITAIISLAIYTRWDAKKDFKECENKLEKQEEEITKIKRSAKISQKASDDAIQRNEKRLVDFGEKSDDEIKEFRKDADRLFKDQQVRIKWYFWNSFSSNTGNADYFMLLSSLNHYVKAEYEYFHEFSKFVCVKEFAELESYYNFVLTTLKEKNFQYHKRDYDLVEKTLGRFKEFPQFLESVERILKRSKNLILNPSLNLPPQKPKT